MPTSCASISALPCDRMVSSTFWARRARSSSLTGRPWHAFRTPESTLARLNGSDAPDRLITLRLEVSSVVKRRVASRARGRPRGGGAAGGGGGAVPPPAGGGQKRKGPAWAPPLPEPTG